MLDKKTRYILTKQHFSNKPCIYTEEAKLLADVKEFLDTAGILYTREEDATRRGVSDIIACFMGRYIAIETKDNTGTPTPQQLKFITDVQQSYGYGIIARNLKDITDVLDKILVQ